MRWGMVIDLRRCVGCQTCTIACKQENALPAGTAWRFVADCEVGEYPDVRRMFLPIQCMQCADPPCVGVCPTGASRQRSDGIVWIDADQCIGCGYCAVACSFQGRHLVNGIMTKCNFCMARIDRGRAQGLVPGRDAEATPMCAVACITEAIVFGDLDDPSSRVARLVAESSAQPLMAELGSRPSVYYRWD
jgi:phenylacetyl-CoA:acceptor oxidoreductase 27-kDa subunit